MILSKRKGPLFMKSEFLSTNVLTFIQDKSIFNILSFVLKSKGILLHNYKEPSVFKTTTFSIIIIDTDVKSQQINDYLKICKTYSRDSKILLAINQNYSLFLLKTLPFSIKGIIYKPFVAEELTYIIESSCKVP